jgi:hypothetical protein
LTEQSGNKSLKRYAAKLFWTHADAGKQSPTRTPTHWQTPRWIAKKTGWVASALKGQAMEMFWLGFVVATLWILGLQGVWWVDVVLTVFSEETIHTAKLVYGALTVAGLIIYLCMGG